MAREMKKDKRLFYNTVTPVLLESVTIISGFILPRLILMRFGSDVNGLVQSITQFLSVIAFFEMGIGSVVKYNLYKPLYENDLKQVSRIVAAANRFFRTLALGFLGYTVILVFAFPAITDHAFSFVYTAFLICAMCISYFAQYYFGQVNQILLTADQRGFIQYCSQIVTILLNLFLSIFLINNGASIQLVKLISSCVFLLRPVFLNCYVKKHYTLDRRIKYDDEPIDQKWNGIAQHLSAVILDQTDIIVLTFFSTLSNISVYSVYNMITAGIKRLITTATSGIQARLGNVIAKGDREEVWRLFGITE